MKPLLVHKQNLIHRKIAPINFGLLVTSDTRSSENDLTGQTIIKLMNKHGYQCLGYQIVRNKLRAIRHELRKYLKSPQIKLILTSGGTGCGKRDLTIEAVTPFLEKKLDGFGELFRLLSYQKIGSAAFMSRAMLGISKEGKIICCLPGSVHAVQLALTKLLIPEVSHLVHEIQR